MSEVIRILSAIEQGDPQAAEHCVRAGFNQLDRVSEIGGGPHDRAKNGLLGQTPAVKQ